MGNGCKIVKYKVGDKILSTEASAKAYVKKLVIDYMEQNNVSESEAKAYVFKNYKVSVIEVPEGNVNKQIQELTAFYEEIKNKLEDETSKRYLASLKKLKQTKKLPSPIEVNLMDMDVQALSVGRVTSPVEVVTDDNRTPVTALLKLQYSPEFLNIVKDNKIESGIKLDQIDVFVYKNHTYESIKDLPFEKHPFENGVKYLEGTNIELRGGNIFVRRQLSAMDFFTEEELQENKCSDDDEKKPFRYFGRDFNDGSAFLEFVSNQIKQLEQYYNDICSFNNISRIISNRSIISKQESEKYLDSLEKVKMSLFYPTPVEINLKDKEFERLTAGHYLKTIETVTPGGNKTPVTTILKPQFSPEFLNIAQNRKIERISLNSIDCFIYKDKAYEKFNDLPFSNEVIKLGSGVYHPLPDTNFLMKDNKIFVNRKISALDYFKELEASFLDSVSRLNDKERKKFQPNLLQFLSEINVQQEYLTPALSQYILSNRDFIPLTQKYNSEIIAPVKGLSLAFPYLDLKALYSLAALNYLEKFKIFNMLLLSDEVVDFPVAVKMFIEEQGDILENFDDIDVNNSEETLYKKDISAHFMLPEIIVYTDLIPDEESFGKTEQYVQEINIVDSKTIDIISYNTLWSTVWFNDYIKFMKFKSKYKVASGGWYGGLLVEKGRWRTYMRDKIKLHFTNISDYKVLSDVCDEKMYEVTKEGKLYKVEIKSDKVGHVVFRCENYPPFSTPIQLLEIYFYDLKEKKLVDVTKKLNKEGRAFTGEI